MMSITTLTFGIKLSLDAWAFCFPLFACWQKGAPFSIGKSARQNIHV